MSATDPPRRPGRWHVTRIAPQTPIVAYLAVVGWIGLASGGIVPAEVLHRTLPSWLVIMWTLAIAAGGTLATAGEVSKQTRVESGGLGLLCYGSVVYGVVGALSVHSSPAGPVLVCSAIAAMCLLRMHTLSQARRAQKVANRLGREG